MVLGPLSGAAPPTSARREVRSAIEQPEAAQDCRKQLRAAPGSAGRAQAVSGALPLVAEKR
eukprot:3149266-Alexandrium_andersonii.AAC.1